MKILITCLFSAICLFSIGQDYPKMARDLQPKNKDDKALILQSTTEIEFSKGSKAPVKVSLAKRQKLLSLRYNEFIFETEWYDQNSRVEKFFATSSLKQRASDETKKCGAYTSEGLFYDDSKFCVQELKLKELGEVWDITSEKQIDDSRYLNTIYLQEKFPLQEKKVTFVIPDDIDIEIKEFNFSDYKITKAERTVSGKKVIEYLIKDLPAMTHERMERGNQYTTPHLLVLVKSAIQNGKKVSVLSSPQDLYVWYSGLTGQLKPNHDVFKSTVTQLTQNKKTDEDKIKAIYYWVQDNIRYIAFEDGVAAFKPSEAQDVFQKKYGDCKGMANLTKEMLRAAGYDARLTWIGTRRIMYDQSIPSLAVNNHMICTLFLNGKKYYLDATEKYIPFGENAARIQSRSVMIEDGSKFILDKVVESPTGSDLDQRKLIATINGNNLEGTFNVDLKGEAKKNFLYGYHYAKSDVRSEFVDDFISTGNKNVKTTDLQLPNMEERSGPLSLACKITMSNSVSSFNNEYYIDIDPAKSFKNMNIEETRQNDIDFGEKINRKTLVELTIPDGYSVSYLPEKVDISDPEFSFHIQYMQKGNKIIYTKELNVQDGIIKKKSISRWNAAIKQLAKGYEDQIVLKK